MPKKLQQKLKEGEAVDLQAVVKEIDEEIAEINKQNAKPVIEVEQPKVLLVYSPFSVDGVEYKIGDVFTPPAGWTRDDSFEEFREVSRKNKGAQEIGIAFAYAGEIIDPKTKERQSRRAVLPIKEA
jgi:hypothetical protein